MTTRRIFAALFAASVVSTGSAFVSGAGAQPSPAPGLPVEAQDRAESADPTPPRVSYMTGEVSFWRPGAQDWAPAQLNTPLAPGDVLYTGQGANVEVQIGPGAFVRAADGAQLGLDNQEPDFIQLRVTAGHVALDLRFLIPYALLLLFIWSRGRQLKRRVVELIDVAAFRIGSQRITRKQKSDGAR